MPQKETKQSAKKNSGSEAKSRENRASMEVDPEEFPNEEQTTDTLSSLEEETPEEKVDPIVAAELAKELGNAKFKVKKYGEAIDLYTQAFGLNPNEASYLTNRAACYMALKRYKSAIEDCQSAVHLQRASPQPKTLLRLARCQFALGRPSQSLASIHSVLAVDSANTDAISLRQKVNALQNHLDRHRTAVESGEWILARLALENAEKMIDGSVPIEWRCWKIDIEIRRKRWDAATSAASDALRVDSSSPEVLTVRAIERLKDEGNAAFKAGRHAEAVVRYTETLEAIGERPEEGEGGQLRALILSNRAAALLKIEKYQEALIDTSASLKIHPSYYKSIRTRARIRLALEEYEEAIEDFKSALESSAIEASTAEQKSIEKEIRLAEVQLKRSKTKDYYKILGVSKTASQPDIKKAYRRESLIHHPDKGGDEEKFKLVVEAHAVLSDPARRERYDSGADEDGQTESGGMGGGGPGGGVDLSDLFGMGGGFGGFPGGSPFGGGGGGGGFPGGGRGGGGHYHNPYGF
ncbi:hypothetical protein BS47DRAFT_1375789 [Hydnum rufescens UP504]|uniref:J domain-containing protein n=1 Tax=Hydnum rufescens UP504 TaxID=1448309 RepID=A0A9P6DX51_9AGAM|nr:hypothetical protein BS47DRAFT_1375789 [Hydnum rufescens UP504]